MQDCVLIFDNNGYYSNSEIIHKLYGMHYYLYFFVKENKIKLLLTFISIGGKAFLETLLPRLNPKNSNGGPSMPFEIEVSLDFQNFLFI